MPGPSGFQVRERSVPRGHRGSAPEVKAVDQGGHDGLSEELVIAKGIGERAGRAGIEAGEPVETLEAIDIVILGEAILGLPGEARNPAALILDAAAQEPTLDRAARKRGSEDGGAEDADGDRRWGEEVTNASQSGFSVAAGDVGESVRIHEPADAAADSPLRVHLFLPRKGVAKGETDALTSHVGPIVIAQEADHELTRAEDPAAPAEPELIVAAAAAAGQPASPAIVRPRSYLAAGWDQTGHTYAVGASRFVIEEAVTNTAGDVAAG